MVLIYALIVWVLMCLAMACHSPNEERTAVAVATNDTIPSVHTESAIFRNDTMADTQLGGYGYLIKLDGRMYVHQPNIPAVAGNKGFESEDDARKVAQLMEAKIKGRVMPPSVTTDELDSLGIKY